ncbi:hypothetical protein CTAYLR_004399 [Chrysophaeum taylorii]|uniref:tRNA (guanine(10)-N(2))-methyltransferase n=1 Tax=Chrysophaeum taylorii TaxID=2483200 RepID=A0AAD7XTH2_9STRA|nr:hypothetical protein CTAYLR_004399 [Chrysophaeum taylorii]
MEGAYLLRFITMKHTSNFRFAELDALLEALGVDPASAYDRAAARRDEKLAPEPCPYLVVRLASPEVAKALCEYGILLSHAIELWGSGTTHEECAVAVASYGEKRPHFFRPEASWRIDVDAYGTTIPLDEQNTIRAIYASALPFQGRVNLAAPTETFQIVDYSPSRRPTDPRVVYFGRTVGATTKRDLVRRCDLKKRVYLGPTALDNELALVMANVARCRPGAAALDPYAGTGSILVACALFGAHCFGADIDWRVLRGKARDENDGAMRRRGPDGRGASASELLRLDSDRKTIFANFRQYALSLPEIVRLDASRFFDYYRDRALSEFFDALVTDPPYGIRAGARCLGSRPQDTVKPVPDDMREDHVPRTKPYPVADVLADLLEIAARVLKLNGRLAYLLPSTHDFFPDRDVPKHPALELLDCCAQPISTKYSRYLVVMRKHRPCDQCLVAWFAGDAAPETRELIRATADAPYVRLKEKVFQRATANGHTRDVDNDADDDDDDDDDDDSAAR